MPRLIIGALIFLVAVHPHPSMALLLNEVMANPAGSEYTDEYIELLQQDSVAVDLTGWSIFDGEGIDELISPDGTPPVLEAGALAIILDSGHAGAWDARLPPEIVRLTVPDGALCGGGLSNSVAERLSLLNPAGVEVDAVWTRPQVPEDFSLERRDAPSVCDSCWTVGRQSGGSPGWPNSVLRRSWDALVRLEDQQVLVAASGVDGCGGNLWLTLGESPCVTSFRVEDLDLDPGEILAVALPAAPLEGLNPLRVELEDAQGGLLLVLDTLWQTPLAPGGLVVEAVQPAGEDWLQLAWQGPCPVLLDGLVVETRGFSQPLSGWLSPQGRLLLGSTPPTCTQSRHVMRTLSLALAGTVWLKDGDGHLLDEAQWPEEGSAGHPWRRLDSSQSGDDARNWRQEAGLAPGCMPMPLGGELPQGSESWAINRRVLVPGGNGEDLLVARQASEGPWTLDVFSLAGEHLLHRRGRGSQALWSGEGEHGPLRPALYLVRLAGTQGETLFPVALSP